MLRIEGTCAGAVRTRNKGRQLGRHLRDSIRNASAAGRRIGSGVDVGTALIVANCERKTARPVGNVAQLIAADQEVYEVIDVLGKLLAPSKGQVVATVHGELLVTNLAVPKMG